MKILVVDDNRAAAQTLGWMLEMLGHEYSLAHSGNEALAVASSYIPDLVLLDLGLPEMNGYDVCQNLRKMPSLKETVIVAQTGWSDQKYRDMSYEAGFNHYLVKPVEIKDLERLLS